MRNWIMSWWLILSVSISLVEVQASSSLPDGVHWYDWGAPAFQKAQTEDKLILLDLTAVWCHACHVMDETTYADPAIASILNASFVPVRVDTDQHPALEARYRAGGWPTTSLLLPTGEILFQANALTPSELKKLLSEAKELYVQEKVDLQKQAKELWAKVQEGATAGRHQQDLSWTMVAQSVAFMKSQYDAEHGGFRSAPKFFEPEAVHLALALGFMNKDRHLMQMGLYTLDQQIALLDPVWGGFYRYAEQADWSDPHYEKILSIQAGNLQNYLEAFQLTGNPTYQTTAESVLNYVWNFLTDHTRGEFWESQDADFRSPNGVLLLSGAEFFPLDAEERNQTGQPAIDRRVFTGSNASMAEVFITASWILDWPELRVFALRVLNKLHNERWDKVKGLWHVSPTNGSPVVGLLSDHLSLGRALVSAFQSTGEKIFLDRAENLAMLTEDLLEDRQAGGFFDRAPDHGGLGLLKMPIKPPQENLKMVLWYLDLFHLTQKQEYRVTAERTIRAVISANQPLPIALMGKMVDRWFRGNVHVAVVGKAKDPKTMALLAESHRFYYPGKLVRLINPEVGPPQWGEISFPYHGHPVAFACTDRMCSPPVASPEGIQASILNVMEAK